MKTSILSNPAWQICLAIAVIAAAGTISLRAQTTAFSYQGALSEGGQPATGPFDLPRG